MYVFSFALLLVLSCSCLASDPQPRWGDWSVDALNNGCNLKRSYYIPFPSDSKKRGFLADSSFTSAAVQFVVLTRTHGDIITNEQLDKLRFDFYVLPDGYPDIPAERRIRSANIGGFEALAVPHPHSHAHSLNEDDSSLLLQKFMQNEIIPFELRFANGTKVKFDMYPSPNRNLQVLVAMFRTCVRDNRECSRRMPATFELVSDVKERLQASNKPMNRPACFETPLATAKSAPKRRGR